MTEPGRGKAGLTTVAQGRLALTGEVTATNVSALRAEGERQIRAARAAGERNLTLNLAELATASSIVLSLLLCWQRFARAEGLALICVGTSERLRSLAALSGLEACLPESPEQSLP